MKIHHKTEGSKLIARILEFEVNESPSKLCNDNICWKCVFIKCTYDREILNIILKVIKTKSFNPFRVNFYSP